MNTYNVLIIEDHQIIIDIYKSALIFVQEDIKDVQFIIDEAKDCELAFKKIKSTSKQRTIDLIFLDISLPPSSILKISSGEGLADVIVEYFPRAKIIVCTSLNDNYRLNNIIKVVNPDCLMVKCDIDFKDIVLAVKTVLDNETYYSKTVISLVRKKASNGIILDDYDIQILREISNGAKMKELLQLIPLSKAGIEKRKRKLKIVLNIKQDNDRELILTARDKGFI